MLHFILDFEINMSSTEVTVGEGVGNISIGITRTGSLSGEAAIICYTKASAVGKMCSHIIFFGVLSLYFTMFLQVIHT